MKPHAKSALALALAIVGGMAAYKSATAEAFPDEDIFMAIADDIGFDATGKPTKVNELDEIGAALADFINEEAEA